MSSTVDRLAFAALLTSFKVTMDDDMPIRIRPCDKNSSCTQQADISLVTRDPILVSQASYTAHEGVFGCYADQYKQC